MLNKINFEVKSVGVGQAPLLDPSLLLVIGPSPDAGGPAHPTTTGRVRGYCGRSEWRRTTSRKCYAPTLLVEQETG